MGFVKKCKRVWRSNNRLYPEETCGGSYGKLSSDKSHKQKDNIKQKKPVNGCVCVYVGPERQRFIIKIKIFNHPLFKTLLEGVENEYGYRNDGPLWLPCDVEFFCETLVEIESADEDDTGFVGCSFPMGHRNIAWFPILA
ncbi:unnamed protein product [Lathyrus sativus]|nr:unnamed protein product [Lathyrus sativus]